MGGALLLLVAGCAALRGGRQNDPIPNPPLAQVGLAADEAAPGSAPAPVAPQGVGGAVASAHPLASEAGAQILREGGTAFDAAVATALVLGVVNPQSSGIGGGGFAVYKLPDAPPAALDFRETAPSFFGPDTFSSDPNRSSSRGPWSTGVPGEVAGLGELHARGGALPWARVVEPARALAADGFPVGPTLARALEAMGDAILADPGMRAVFAPNGPVLREGERCVRPALARTLEYLQLHGAAGFYEGPIALALAGFLAEQGLAWSEEELSAYRVADREPIALTYRGHTVYAMPPPSSGGVVLVQVLGLLERKEHHGMEFGSPQWTRLLAQSLTHAFADRATYLADPDFVPIAVGDLVSPATLDALAQRLPESGPVATLDAGLSGLRGDSRGLLPQDGGTSHLSVLDGAGNAVALTTTINLWFGSGQLDPQTGVLLNDEMDDFAARPGEPNAFGLIQSERNAPGPQHRPLSSMSPTLVADGQGRVTLAVGAAGGPRIITGTLQALLGVLDRGLSPSEAVAAPRMHHQWLPESVALEARFPAPGRTALEAEGFEVEDLSRSAVVQAVTFDPASGQWDGAGDPRADGDCVVVPRP